MKHDLMIYGMNICDVSDGVGGMLRLLNESNSVMTVIPSLTSCRYTMQ
jgi:hypothetical protein